MLNPSQSISEKLPDAEPDLLVAHTAVLAQVARFRVNVFEHKSDTIMAFLVKKLLMAPSKDPVSVCPLDTFLWADGF